MQIDRNTYILPTVLLPEDIILGPHSFSVFSGKYQLM